jgi:Flp pilus assembly CpaF family ATPase
VNPELVAVSRRVAGEVAERLAAEQNRRERAGLGRLEAGGREALADQLVREALDGFSAERLGQAQEPMSAADEDEVARTVLDRVCGAFGFTRWLEDPAVEEIVFNRFDNVWVYWSDGRRERVEPIAESATELVEQLRMLAATTGRTERRFDSGQPRLNLSLADGSRLYAVMDVSGDSPAGAIRRSRYPDMDLDLLIRLGTIDKALYELFAAMVSVGMRVIISGEVSAGKTGLMRAMLHRLDSPDRVVLIEDTAEADLAAFRGAHANTLELETREPNIEGQGAITQRDLVRDALRLHPDWLIVSECRGAEALDMLMAMSHGQRSLSTLHAKRAADVPDKLATYCAIGPENTTPATTHLLVSQAVDFIIHMRQLRNGQRAVVEVLEVEGFEEARVRLNTVFEPGPDGRGRPAGQHITEGRLDELAAVGFDHNLLLNRDGWWA